HGGYAAGDMARQLIQPRTICVICVHLLISAIESLLGATAGKRATEVLTDVTRARHLGRKRAAARQPGAARQPIEASAGSTPPPTGVACRPRSFTTAARKPLRNHHHRRRARSSAGTPRVGRQGPTPRTPGSRSDPRRPNPPP